MEYKINSYESAHATAYKLLNLVVEKLEDVDYTIVRLIKWSWQEQPAIRQTNFVIVYNNEFTFTVSKHHKDMFNDEWYHSAAETISAWLLLQRGVSKIKSKRS